MDGPTYADLIKVLEEAESVGCEASITKTLLAKFSSRFPHIQISRPSRFLDTVRRIAAPTRPSTVGEAKLDGSPLRSYLKRRWTPRIRNTQGEVMWMYSIFNVSVHI